MITRRQINVFDTWLDVISYDDTLDMVLNWSGEKKAPRLIGFAALNVIFTNRTDPQPEAIYADFDLVLHDGRNIARIARLLGERFIEKRIAGMDFLPDFLRRAVASDLTFFAICANAETGESLKASLKKMGARDESFLGSWSPPFRTAFTRQDIEPALESIRALKPHVVILGIASPKQEQIGKLLKKHGNSPVTVLCVGGAVPTTVGMIPVGPQWMRDAGLESFYRFFCEPRRLFRRYLVFNLWIFPFLVEALILRVFRRKPFGRDMPLN